MTQKALESWSTAVRHRLRASSRLQRSDSQDTVVETKVARTKIVADRFVLFLLSMYMTQNCFSLPIIARLWVIRRPLILLVDLSFLAS